MSVPTTPTAVPVTSDPTPVQPQTPRQLKRSGWWLVLAGVGAGVAAGATALQEFAPQIEPYVPAHYVHAFGMLMVAVNFWVLASQKFHGAANVQGVNYSEPGGGGV